MTIRVMVTGTHLVRAGNAMLHCDAYFHASTAEALYRVYTSLNGQIVLEREQREITAS